MSVNRRPTRADIALFTPIVQRYGRRLDSARCVVKDGRKVGYILSEGVLDSSCCFVNDRPAATFKTAPSACTHTIIPNHFQIAVNVKGTPYLGEVEYVHNIPMYKFSQLSAQGDIVKTSGLFASPTPAFLDLFTSSCHPNEVLKINGKLLIGLPFEEPQRLLRLHFSQPGRTSAEIQPLFAQLFPEPGITVALSSPASTSTGEDEAEDDFIAPLDSPAIPAPKKLRTCADGSFSFAVFDSIMEAENTATATAMNHHHQDTNQLFFSAIAAPVITSTFPVSLMTSGHDIILPVPVTDLVPNAPTSTPVSGMAPRLQRNESLNESILECLENL